MSVGAIKAGSAYVDLFTRNNRLISGLNDASRRLSNFGRSVQQIGRQMAMFGIGAAIPIGLAVRRFAEFDDQMRLLRAVSQGTEAEFQTLVESARELGVVSGFTAVQIGSLMVELGKAGLSRRQIDAATQSIVNLARGTGEDVTTVSTIVGQAMRQFQLAADEAARVSDLFLVAANSSISSVESLGEALHYTGADAARFNLSLEDTLAILAALSNIGIQGSNAGTALRRLLTLTGTQAAEVRRLFGVEAVDAAGNARNIADVLAEIDASLEGLGTAERSQRLFELFGFLGITAASGLGQNISNIRELQEALRGAEGAAARTAAAMDAGLGGVLRRLRGTVESVAISIGEALAPALMIVGRHVKDLLVDFKDWVQENRELAVILGTGVGAVVGLGVALIGLGLAFKLVGFAIGAVGTVLAIVGGAFQIVLALLMGVLSPIGMVTLALTAGALAWAYWSQSGQTAALGISTALSQVARIASLAFGGIIDAIHNADLQGAMRIAWLGLQASWASGVAVLKESWREFRDFFIDMFWSAVYSVGRALVHLAHGFADVIAGMFRAAQAVGEHFGLNVLGGLALDEILKQLDSGTGGVLGTLDQMQEEERALRQQQREAARAGDQAEVQRIMRELADLRAQQALRRQIKDRLGIKEMLSGQGGGGRGGVLGGGGITEPKIGPITTAGTFSGAAVAGLGASSSLTQKTNDLLSGIERQIRGLRQEVREGGAQFG